MNAQSFKLFFNPALVNVDVAGREFCSYFQTKLGLVTPEDMTNCSPAIANYIRELVSKA